MGKVVHLPAEATQGIEAPATVQEQVKGFAAGTLLMGGAGAGFGLVEPIAKAAAQTSQSLLDIAQQTGITCAGEAVGLTAGLWAIKKVFGMAPGSEQGMRNINQGFVTGCVAGLALGYGLLHTFNPMTTPDRSARDATVNAAPSAPVVQKRLPAAPVP